LFLALADPADDLILNEPSARRRAFALFAAGAIATFTPLTLAHNAFAAHNHAKHRARAHAPLVFARHDDLGAHIADVGDEAKGGSDPSAPSNQPSAASQASAASQPSAASQASAVSQASAASQASAVSQASAASSAPPAPGVPPAPVVPPAPQTPPGVQQSAPQQTPPRMGSAPSARVLGVNRQRRAHRKHVRPRRAHVKRRFTG
jgi:hypothetical protein